MANGSGGRRDYDFNPKWCEERHKNLDIKLQKVWGEYGFGAVWKRMDRVESHLWKIIIGLALNMGGIIAILIKIVIGNGA